MERAVGAGAGLAGHRAYVPTVGFHVGSSRLGVAIFTVEGLAPFVVELLKYPEVTVDGSPATPTEVLVRPRCGEGTVVLRKGRYGDFLGRSRFPKCRQTANV